jgi:hypothetical protein
MNTIIVYCVNGGSVEVVMNCGVSVAVFANRDEAVAYVDANKLFQSGQVDYQIVVLDEL